MMILPKTIYRFNATLIKILMAFFTELKQNTLKFLWKHTRQKKRKRKKTYIAKTILRKKYRTRSFTLPDLKLYHKATVIKTAWGLSRQLSNKESTHQSRRHRCGPRSGKIPHAMKQLSPCTPTAESELWIPQSATTEPSHGDYCSPCPRAHGPRGKPLLHNQRGAPAHHNHTKAHTAVKTQHSQSKQRKQETNKNRKQLLEKKNSTENWHKIRHSDQWNRMDSAEINPHHHAN